MLRGWYRVVICGGFYCLALASPASPASDDFIKSQPFHHDALFTTLRAGFKEWTSLPGLRVQSQERTSYGPVLRRPIPNHLVVLTFDDAAVTHATFAAKILRKYKFGATFFICEFPPNFKDKTKYMSWEQIRQLNQMGFEIGNHTAFHTHVSKMTRPQFEDSLAFIEKKCADFGIPRPITFAYPGYDAKSEDLDVLTQRGYIFARTGLERAYDPLVDEPLLVPGINANGTDRTHVLESIRQAQNGKIVVLTFHGIPDYEHGWVTTPPEAFMEYMRFLKTNHYKVIAFRDLNQYIDPKAALTATDGSVRAR